MIKYFTKVRRDALLNHCQAADAAIRMFAELLGALDETAEVYAAEADRRRIAGLACEASYDGMAAMD